MYTNSKEAAWSDNVSKQLQYDENSEDMGRLVKGSKKEKKKTVQKMSKHNDESATERSVKSKKVSKESSSTTPSDTFQLMLQAALDAARLMGQRGASPATVNEWLQRTLQAAMPMADDQPRPTPSPPPPPSLASMLSTTTTRSLTNDACSVMASPTTTQAAAEPTNVEPVPITPSATSSLSTATPSTPFQPSNITLGTGCSPTQRMLAPAWSSPWTASDRMPWQQSKPDESALLEKIKATCKVEEVQSVPTLMGNFTEIVPAVQARRQQILDWVSKVCPELPLETNNEAIIVTREMGAKLSSACSSHWPLGTTATEVNKKQAGKQIEKLLRDAIQEGKPDRGGAGRGLSNQFRLNALGLPGDITPAYNQQIQQLLIVLEEARLLTLILAILCGNCIYVLDSNSMSATQLRRLKLDATSVKTTELLQKFTHLTIYVDVYLRKTAQVEIVFATCDQVFTAVDVLGQYLKRYMHPDVQAELRDSTSGTTGTLGDDSTINTIPSLLHLLFLNHETASRAEQRRQQAIVDLDSPLPYKPVKELQHAFKLRETGWRLVNRTDRFSDDQARWEHLKKIIPREYHSAVDWMERIEVGSDKATGAQSLNTKWKTLHELTHMSNVGKPTSGRSTSFMTVSNVIIGGPTGSIGTYQRDGRIHRELTPGPHGHGNRRHGSVDRLRGSSRERPPFSADFGHTARDRSRSSSRDRGQYDRYSSRQHRRDGDYPRGRSGSRDRDQRRDHSRDRDGDHSRERHRDASRDRHRQRDRDANRRHDDHERYRQRTRHDDSSRSRSPYRNPNDSRHLQPSSGDHRRHDDQARSRSRSRTPSTHDRRHGTDALSVNAVQHGQYDRPSASNKDTAGSKGNSSQEVPNTKRTPASPRSSSRERSQTPQRDGLEQLLIKQFNVLQEQQQKRERHSAQRRNGRADDDHIFLQKVLRLHQLTPWTANVLRILTDSGAAIALLSKKYLKYLVTDITYPDDALLPKLGSFDGTQSRKVNIIGTAYAALPALGTDGQPVVTVIHAYIADTDDDICILSANQIAKAGGSLMYGTCQKTTIQQVVQTTQGLSTTTHTFTGNVSMLMSPSGGAVPLHEIDDLYYANLLTGDNSASMTPSQLDAWDQQLKTVNKVFNQSARYAPTTIEASYKAALQNFERLSSRPRSDSTYIATVFGNGRELPDGPIHGQFDASDTLYDGDDAQAIRTLQHGIEALSVLHYANIDDRTDERADRITAMYAEMNGYIETMPEERRQSLRSRSFQVAQLQQLGAVKNFRDEPEPATQHPLQFQPTDLEQVVQGQFQSDTTDMNSKTEDKNINKISTKRTIAESEASDKSVPAVKDRSALVHRVQGLSIVILSNTLPLLALLLMTLNPDANVFLFTSANASSIYEMCPIPQMSRLHVCTDSGFQEITRQTLVLSLEDKYRTLQDIDILFIEDMTNSSVLDNFKELMRDIAVNDPHVLICSRTTSTDLTLGATLRQRVTYAVHAPATAAHQVHYASDENRSVSGVQADDESKYINWAYVVQEALDKYIFDTYGKMASIGLLHYPDIAEIALNDLTPAEKEFCMRECDSDDDEMVNQDLLDVCTMMTRSSSSRQPSDDEPRKLKKQKSQSMTSPTTVKLPPPPVKYFVEIGAGSATMTCDWLDANPSGIGLCIDIMDPIEFWTQIPLHLRPRIRYHQSKANEILDDPRLKELLRQYCGDDVNFAMVDVIHFSPECQTLSLAGAKGPMDPRAPGWEHPHRIWDGTSFRPKDDSTKALEDDNYRSTVIHRLLIPWSKAFPHVHITIENPFLSLFLEMDDVKELLKEQGWKVSRADHCIVANPAFDSIVTQKPTTYVTFGFQSFNKVCCTGQRCKFMIPGTEFHKYVIRNSRRAPKEQQRVNDSVLRSRIARGACAFIRSMQLPTALNCAPEPANSTEQCRPRRRTIMPEAILQLWHSRLGHCGRDRLCRALRDYALTKSYVIPRNFRCKACDVSKATRKSHCGHLKPAEYANQMYYCDLINFLVPDIHGNRHALIMVDGKSRWKSAYPIKSKSDASRAIQEHIALVRVPPECLRVDAGGEFKGEAATGLVHLCRTTGIRLEVVTPGEHEAHGIVERANRTLTRMACSMLTAANLGMEYWSYALRHAAYCDTFLSSSDSLPTPYSFWHGVLEKPRRNIAFGAPLLYRQQEKSKQHKLDARAHPAIFLGFANDHGAVYVLDKAIKSSPIRMTCNDLKRSYCEELVVDYTSGLVINPETLIMTTNSTGELSIQEVLAEDSQPPLSPEQEKKLKETMDFYAKRRAELHANTSMTARQVETTILREYKVEELRRLQRTEDNLNRQSTSEPTIGEQQSETPQPTVEQQARKLTKQQLKELQVSDIPCCLCASGHFDDPVTSKRPKRQQVHLLICEGCNRGFHTSCLELHWQPGFSDDDWLCFECLSPGTQVEIQMNHKQKSKFRAATVQAHDNRTGLTSVQFTKATDLELVDLRRYRWRPAGNSATITVATLREVEELTFNIPIPKGMPHLQKMPPSVWKQKWEEAALKEMEGLWESQSYKIIDKIPATERHKPVLPMIIIFKYKPPKIEGEEGIFKARCCLLGNRLDKTASSVPAPTPRMTTVRMVLSMAAKQQAHVMATDVSQAFLNAQPREYNICRLPSGFPGRPYDGKLAILCCNQYGHPCAPAAWATLFSNWMLTIGFLLNPVDACLFQRQEPDGTTTFVLNYVDDAICVSVNKANIDKFKNELSSRFRITADKKLTRYLGIEIKRSEHGFILTQEKLVESLYEKALPFLQKEGIHGHRVPIVNTRLKKSPVHPTPEQQLELNKLPFRSLLGGVGYLVTATMPSIAYAYKEIARFSSSFNHEHWRALLELIAYVKNHPIPLVLSSAPGEELSAFCDADWNASDQHLSTSGYVVMHGTNPIAWVSRTQRCTARSVGESEFVSLSSCTQELLHLRALKSSIQRFKTAPRSVIRTLGDQEHAYFIFQQNMQPEKVHVHTDSASSRLSCQKGQGWQDGKLRHIKTAYHFVRGHVKSNEVALFPVKGTENVADILTKGYANGNWKNFDALARELHGFHGNKLPKGLSKLPDWQPPEL